MYQTHAPTLAFLPKQAAFFRRHCFGRSFRKEKQATLSNVLCLLHIPLHTELTITCIRLINYNSFARIVLCKRPLTQLLWRKSAFEERTRFQRGALQPRRDRHFDGQQWWSLRLGRWLTEVLCIICLISSFDCAASCLGFVAQRLDVTRSNEAASFSDSIISAACPRCCCSTARTASLLCW